MSYVSYVKFHMPYFMCHMSHVTNVFSFFFFFVQSDHTSPWRVCYQQGYPSSVFLDKVAKLVIGWSIINGPIQNIINLFKVINLVWAFSIKLNLCLMERKDLARFNLKFQICHLFTFYNLVKSKYTNY